MRKNIKGLAICLFLISLFTGKVFAEGESGGEEDIPINKDYGGGFRGFISGIISAIKTIFTPSSGDQSPGAGKKEERKEKESALAGKKQEAEKNIDESKAAQEAEVSENNSLTEGDPVQVSTGKYIQKDTDFRLKNFEIFRSYKSGNCITGSFGYGWITNLDSRLVLGINQAEEDLALEYKAYLDELLEEEKSLPEKIKAYYGVKNLDNAKNEFRAGKAQNEAMLEMISDAYFKCVEGNYFNEELPQEEVEASMETLRENIRFYEKALDSIDEELEYLAGIKERIAEVTKDYEKIRNVSEKNEIARKNSVLSNFKGSPDYYQNVGLGNITFIDENGLPHVLLKEGENTWVPDKTALKQIVKLEFNGFVYSLHLRNGEILRFSGNGLLVGKKWQNGTEFVIDRDQQGKINFLSDSFNEKMIFEYEKGFISKIYNQRSSSNCVVYKYQNSCLSEIRDENLNILKLKYDSEKYLTQLIKADNSTVSILYGTSSSGDKKVSSTVDEEGNQEFFEYDSSKRETKFIDYEGKKTIHRFDKNNQTILKLDDKGNVFSYEYDSDENLACINLNGDLTRHEYDSFGRKIFSRYSDSSFEEWKYDFFGNTIFYKTRDGIENEYVRDDKGNLVGLQKNGNLIFEQSFNSKGLPERQVIKGEPDICILFTYDSYGNVIKRIKGTVTETFTYDSQNRLSEWFINNEPDKKIRYGINTKEISCYNGLRISQNFNNRKDLVSIVYEDTKTGELRKLKIEYDKKHNPVRFYAFRNGTPVLLKEIIYSPIGNIQKEIEYAENESFIKEYTYKNGTLHSCSEYKNSDSPEIRTVYYDILLLGNNKKQITKIMPSGIIETYETDPYGRFEKYIDSEGDSFDYVFSPEGRILERTDPFGGKYTFSYNDNGLVEAFGEVYNRKNQRTYYLNGKIKTESNTLGEKKYFEYDSNGNLVYVTEGNNSRLYNYDCRGRVISKISGFRNDTNDAEEYVLYEYADDGRSVLISYGNLVFEKKTFNAFGEIIKQEDGNGNVTSFEYDFLGRLIRKTDPYGFETSYEYCGRNQIKKIFYPDKSFNEYEYDDFGNLLLIKKRNQILWEGKYDAENRLISCRNSPGVEKKYLYDGKNRIISESIGNTPLTKYFYSDYGKNVFMIDGNGNEYKYEKDSYGRLLKETNRLGDVQTFFYDSEGRLSEKCDFEGNVTEYTYGESGTSEKNIFKDGSEIQFLYNSNHRIVKASYGKENIYYTYNKAGLLESLYDEAVNEKISYEYDSSGHRIRLINGNRNIIYRYGKNGELIEQTDVSQNMKILFKYDCMGREICRTFGNGNCQETGWNQNGRIKYIVEKDSYGALLRGEAYVYDSFGRKIAVAETNGKLMLFEYNDSGMLSSVYYSGNNELQKIQKNEAQKNGINVEEDDTGFVNFHLSYTLHEEIKKQLKFMIPFGAEVPSFQICLFEEFAYDKNGNRISKTNGFGKIDYRYDSENRLIFSGANGKDVVKYQYSKNGNLLSEESAAGRKDYSYNYFNRINSSRVFDSETECASLVWFSYDSFGRRLVSGNADGTATRILYDGFSFDAVKENPVWSNGMFTDNFILPYEAVLDEGRFRYLSETVDKDRYRFLSNNTEAFSGNVTEGKSLMFVKGKPVARSYETKVSYFGTDDQGTVKSISDNGGNVQKLLSYDVFGKPFENSLVEYGYNGKPFDSFTELYDYGYRDYIPELASFQTQDPVRDGPNWFQYAGGDPVNFVDLWGLEIVRQTGTYKMNVGDWSDKTLGNGLENLKLSNAGCTTTAIANIATTKTGKEVTPEEINSQKGYYASEGKYDNLDTLGIAKEYGLNGQVINTAGKDIDAIITEFQDSETKYYLMAKVKYDENDHTHFVGINDYVDLDGDYTIEINGTSKNDIKDSRRRDTWMRAKGSSELYVEISDIVTIYAYTDDGTGKSGPKKKGD